MKGTCVTLRASHGGRTGWWSRHFEFESDVTESSRSMIGNTLQRNGEFEYQSQTVVSCRHATVVRWLDSA